MNTMPSSRYPLELDIEFKRSYGRNSISGTLKNISLTGTFIENSLKDLNFRDKISISLNLSGRKRVVSATVVWKNHRGCGVRFLPFNSQDIQIIDDLVYFLESKRKTKKTVLSDIFKNVA